MRPTFFEAADDLADEVTGNAVGLDDGQSALERHANDSLGRGRKGARLYRLARSPASNSLKFNVESSAGDGFAC
jgi:hypothetical protein